MSELAQAFPSDCRLAESNQLICLSNMENLNALFIEEGMPQVDRLLKLNRIAIHQMQVLEDDNTNRKALQSDDPPQLPE